MKSVFRLLSSLTILAAVVCVRPGPAAAENLSVTLPAGTYQLIDQDGGEQTIAMAEFGQLLVPGRPQLPARTFLIAVPPGAVVSRVHIDAAHEVELPGRYRIRPAPVVAPLSQQPDLELQAGLEWQRNFDSVYSDSARYPAQAGEYLGTGALRRYRFVRVAYYPFAFSPQSGKLTFRSALTVSIDYEPGVSTDGDAADRLSKKTHPRASRLLVNFAEIEGAYAAAEETQESALTYDYVVITAASISSALDTLVQWKEMIGHAAKVVTTAWIDSNYTGRDLQERMRNFLVDKYLEWGIEYVLLAGNIDLVPMRTCYPDAENHGSDIRFCPPTDYYYADLTGDWDSDGDGYFGEYGQDSVDFAPEVYVGRIPWSDPDVLSSISRKLVLYEADTGSWKNRALLVGTFANFNNQDLTGYPETDFALLMEKVAVDMLSGWTYTTMYEEAGIRPSAIPHDQAATRANVLNAWATGQYAVISWGGHGSPVGAARLVWNFDDGDFIPESVNPTELSLPYFIHALDAPQLDDTHPAITFQVSCNNAYPEQANLARELLRSGAVGTVASTRIAWYAKGWDHESDGLCASMNYYFFDFLIRQGEKVGEALYNSKAYYAHNFLFDFYRHQQNLFDFCLYGEPALTREGVSFTCADSDTDGVGDPGQLELLCGADNCPTVVNPGQADFDSDGYGDACDDCPALVTPGDGPLMTGDVDADSTIAAADVIYMVNHVFRSGPEPMPLSACGDTDCNAILNAADLMCLINFVFKSGPSPCDVCALQ